MGRKRERSDPWPRRSPNSTVANLSDEFVAELNIPDLPDAIPKRLEEAIRTRVNALLFHLKEARRIKYVGALEVRLVREAQRAVLTAYELNLDGAEILYANFRKLVEDLGYERADVGFVRVARTEPPRPVDEA